MSKSCMYVVLSQAVALLLVNPVSAQQSCGFGAQQWVSGCEAACTAPWDGGDCPQSCIATAPLGQIIIDHRVIDTGTNNGGRSASRVAAGQKFNYARQVRQAFDSAINISAQKGDERYAADLKNSMSQFINEIESLQSTHQAVRLQVNASPHGNKYLDRKRGWSGARVELYTRCVAPPDLTSQLLGKAP